MRPSVCANDSISVSAPVADAASKMRAAELSATTTHVDGMTGLLEQMTNRISAANAGRVSCQRFCQPHRRRHAAPLGPENDPDQQQRRNVEPVRRGSPRRQLNGVYL